MIVLQKPKTFTQITPPNSPKGCTAFSTICNPSRKFRNKSWKSFSGLSKLKVHTTIHKNPPITTPTPCNSPI